MAIWLDLCTVALWLTQADGRRAYRGCAARQLPSNFEGHVIECFCESHWTVIQTYLYHKLQRTLCVLFPSAIPSAAAWAGFFAGLSVLRRTATKLGGGFFFGPRKVITSETSRISIFPQRRCSNSCSQPRRSRKRSWRRSRRTLKSCARKTCGVLPPSQKMGVGPARDSNFFCWEGSPAKIDDRTKVTNLF